MKQKTQQITIIMKKKKTKFRIIHLLLEIGFWIASSSSMALAQDTLSKAQKDFIIEQSFTVQEQKNSLLLKDSSIISLNVIISDKDSIIKQTDNQFKLSQQQTKNCESDNKDNVKIISKIKNKVTFLKTIICIETAAFVGTFVYIGIKSLTK